jgi:hypothetical protein
MSLKGSSGEIKATTTEIHPATNAPASHFRMPFPTPARAQSRRSPRM